MFWILPLKQLWARGETLTCYMVLLVWENHHGLILASEMGWIAKSPVRQR